MRLTLFTEKAGVFGAIIAAMGCASCFPALGALGAAVGMGFLAQFEGLFINTLLPFFAWLALIASLVAGYKHRRWWRLLLSVAGPLMILATLYLFWTDSWSTPMFYFAIALMFFNGIADLIKPPQRHCSLARAEEKNYD
ncbi:organomercurial transporter MerC [Aliamphritea hakodatensis]|uniref:organomercurial transporter MerC n=1 Tax=Aliamphritea hakodatensis TaxID=2895352 RepID=UPI0022FD765A|nr:organomercurial transporter MerC [Aliamphritea hakodatensis]